MDELLEILKELHDDIDFETHKTLIAEVDDRIGVSIPPEELIPENFNSYQAISALIKRLEEE